MLGLVASVGLGLSLDDPFAALAPLGSGVVALTVGGAVGLAFALVLWLLRWSGPVRTLEGWQREMVGSWTALDAVAVAVLSGLAEEALLRALLQPVIGLVPAAVIFAVLHFLPDRRLWLWPLLALASGLVLGLLFTHYGFPAAAAAHTTVNLVGLLRLRRVRAGATASGRHDGAV